MMSKSFLVFAVSLLSIVCWGCTSDVSTPEPAATAETEQHGDHDHAHGKLCGSCGDAKGSESCCSESATKCGDCGLTAGSKLCCVELDETAKGKDLCLDCGHVAGTENCCSDAAEKCDCGMAKGSPLCCKLKDADAAE